MTIVVRDAGSVLVHAHDRGIDHLHRSIMTGGQRVDHMVPDAGPPPAHEAVVTSGARTIGLWQVAPRRTRSQNPKDAVEHATVIYTRDATRFVRQNRFDGGPFVVAEFCLVRGGR